MEDTKETSEIVNVEPEAFSEPQQKVSPIVDDEVL